MDTTTATDTLVDAALDSEISFPREIAKTLALSAATTAGMVVGLGAVGLGWNKIMEIKEKRSKKVVETAEPETKTTAKKNR